jgi:hypothetical protein
MTVTHLLHRAALAGATIYWDNEKQRAVMWSRRELPARLVGELQGRAHEINELLGRSGFWACCCRECRGTVH